MKQLQHLEYREASYAGCSPPHIFSPILLACSRESIIIKIIKVLEAKCVLPLCKKDMNCLKYIFALLLLLASFSLHAAQFHVLLAADTLTEVKKASKKDLKHMRCELYFASKAIGTDFQCTELFGMKLTQKRCLNWVDSTTIGSDDVVIVYYTGHGLRTNKSPSIWPYLYFPAHDEIINTNQFLQKIMARGPRLAIILIDCCNNVIADRKVRRQLDPKALFQNHEKALLHTGYRKLFLQTQGVIIASGSIPGKRSWATSKGGVFTNAFLNSLRYEASEKEPRWAHILNKTKRLCAHFQKPQYQMKIGDQQSQG